MSRAGKACIGIIAENCSDVNSVKIMIYRIANRTNIGVKKFIGHGCGKIMRKCASWANNLKMRGCNYLILIHDLDQEDLDVLRCKLNTALSPCPIDPYLICIPIEEIEAWWLADPNAIKTALNLDRIPRIRGNPQTIHSPKEFLGRLVSHCSNNRIIYLNTRHNEKIAEHLDFTKVMRCDSFEPFFDFVTKHITATA